jgi:hypothetical protein
MPLVAHCLHVVEQERRRRKNSVLKVAEEEVE